MPAYQENADWNVGRLLDAIEEMGDLENTLIFYIWGDNGASMEGTTTGSFNEMTFLNGVVLEADQQLEADRPVRRDRRRSAANTPHRTSPRPGRTPATHHFSGASRWPAISAGRATRWSSPGRSGSSRTATCAASSRTASTSRPTVLEAAGMPEPKTVDGIEQEPMDGTSFLYTLRRCSTRRSVTRCSTSSSPGPERSTRTAGGRARSWTGSRGTSRPRR